MKLTDFTYLAVAVLITAATAFTLWPEKSGVAKYSEMEQRYGKMPRDYARYVRDHYKKSGTQMLNVTCFGVVASPEHEGWVSTCTYKVKTGYGMWSRRFGEFVVNREFQRVKMNDWYEDNE